MLWKVLRAGAFIISGLTTVFTGTNSLQAANTNFNWIAATPSDYGIAANWDRLSVPNGSVNYVAIVTNNGTVNFTTSDFALIGQMALGASNNTRGSLNVTGGTLIISNANTMIPLFVGGYGSGTSTSPNTGLNSVASVTVGGGSLIIARNTSGGFYQDGVDLGVSTNSIGTFTVSNGIATLMCGMEIGLFGTGVVNLYGGVLIDNSWFGIGRGVSGPYGSGLVNITNGSLYIVRNINDENNNTRGFYFCVAGTNGVANISGGSIYVNRVGFAANSSATETLNMSGGSFYIGSDGVSSSSAQPVVNISGGVFHTVDMVTNGSVILRNGNPYTVGNCDTNSVLADGTNWIWATTPAVNLTSSIPGLGGVGYVTFAPEAGRTISLYNTWSGAGGFLVNGPGAVAIGGSNTYTGGTTISQGTLAMLGGGSLSGNIVVAPNGTFAGTSSGPAYTLNAQTLRNTGTTPTLSGNINAGSGTIALTYAAGAPAFTVANGTFGLTASAIITINNTGSALPSGSYKIISAGAGGAVTLPGGLPGVTVNGGGIAPGLYASLNISGSELYLIVSGDRPPSIANVVTNNVYYGTSWQIAITNLAALAGWSDPDGDTVTLSGVGPTSGNGTNISTDGANIYYNGVITSNDYFNYTITDGTLTTMGSVFLNLLNSTTVIPSDTNYVISLNGTWRFYFERSNYDLGTPPNVVLPDASQPFQRLDYIESPGWTNLAVPGNWEMAGLSPATYYSPDDTCGLYRHWIQIPQSWQGRRVYLSMEGVLDGAEIWLNGQPVTVSEPSWNIANYHESGWTGFQVDLTAAANFGTSNLLAVRVIKSTPSDDLDTGDYFVLGGIYRPVTLYSVPQTNLADVQVQTHLLPGNSAQVNVTVDVNAGNASTPVAMIFNGSEVDVAPTNGRAVFSQIVVQPQLWSSEFPNLYPLMVQLKDGNGQVTETFTNRIGIREVTITNGVMYLNGAPIKFAGICTHDSSPTVGSAVDTNFWRNDLLLMKSANINAIRTTHYPFNSAFYDLCDELGMYVADELPYCWCDNETPDPTMQPAFEQRARETIRRDRNHPSVVIWAIGNENAAGTNLQVVADLVHSQDTTRPRLVSRFNATQYNVELSDAHYPSIGNMQSDAGNAQSTGHPFIFTENPNTWDERLGADAGMWEDWGICMQRVWNTCLQYATLPGTFPFEWADRAVQDPNSNASYTQYQSTGVQLLYFFPATGIHLLKMKGVVDSFRNPRPEFYELQMIYSPVQVSNSLSVTSGQLSFPVQNRYRFTDLSYLTTVWQLERDGVTIASGTTNLSLAPLTSGNFQISVPTNALHYADTFRLDFIHPNGNDVFAYQFALTGGVPGSGMTTNLTSLPIPTLNLITRSNYSNPLYWTECQRFPASLTNLVLTPVNATNLAQLQSFTATVIGGTNGQQTLGNVSAQFTNNTFSYTLNWTGATWEIQEAGWAFAMPSNYNHFSWNRNSRWTVYPPYAIGRTTGTATPDSTNIDATDMTLSNSFDFNSTKFGCNWASLTTAAGNGIRLAFSTQTFQCKGGPAVNGGYALIANQEVSAANDLSSSVVPDLYFKLASGNVLQGSFTVGSNTNLSTNGVSGLNDPVSVIVPPPGNPGGNPVQLNFVGTAGASYSVWASTNFANWQWAGPAVEISAGQFQFADYSATNLPRRFYRLSTP